MSTNQTFTNERRDLAAKTAGSDVWCARINAIGLWIAIWILEIAIVSGVLYMVVT